MEEKLKQHIYKNTFAVIEKYRKIGVKLRKLPKNPVLEEFLDYLNGTLEYYDTKYADVNNVNLLECKKQYEPVNGLNKVEQAFNRLEQGFYKLYPNETFRDDIHNLMKGTSPYYDRLNELIGLVETK